MRVLGYLGLLAVIVIICVAAVRVYGGIASASAETGELKAVKQINADGDEKIDPSAEMHDTIKDALAH